MTMAGITAPAWLVVACCCEPSHAKLRGRLEQLKLCSRWPKLLYIPVDQLQITYPLTMLQTLKQQRHNIM